MTLKSAERPVTYTAHMFFLYSRLMVCKYKYSITWIFSVCSNYHFFVAFLGAAKCNFSVIIIIIELREFLSYYTNTLKIKFWGMLMVDLFVLLHMVNQQPTRIMSDVYASNCCKYKPVPKHSSFTYFIQTHHQVFFILSSIVEKKLWYTKLYRHTFLVTTIFICKKC